MIARTRASEGATVPVWRADSRLTELLRRRGDELLRVAVMVAGNRYDAEDAVQEAILSVVPSWSRVTARAEYSYLRTAVVRKAIDGRRRARGSVEFVDRPFDDMAYLRFEEDREFFRIVRGLPEQQRNVLVLRYFAGEDDATIAKLLGCTRSTVRSNATRGLAKLRELTVTPEE